MEFLELKLSLVYAKYHTLRGLSYTLCIKGKFQVIELY